MPESADHRAKAENWLKVAVDTPDDATSTAEALIGIGHALLALAEPNPPHVVTFPAEEVLSKDQAAAIRKILHG